MTSYKSTNTSRPFTRQPRRNLEKAIVVNAFPDDPMGLIPTRYLYSPIEIRLSKIWPFPAQEGEIDYVHFSIKPHTPEPAYPLTPIPLEGPVTQESLLRTPLFIDGNWLRVSGSYDISYYLVGPGGTEHSPFTTTFTLDWQAPGGTAPLLPLQFVDPEIGNHGITEEYLQDHSSVDVRIPSYFDRKAYDDVLVFLLESESANPHESSYVHTFVTVDEPQIVPIPSAKFRVLQNGSRILRYTLRDRAGNQRLDYSGPAPVQINLKPLPNGLKNPYVGAFAYNGLIDRADARVGVTMRLDAYFDWDSTDEAVVSWNGVELESVTVDALPNLISIPWEVLINKGYQQDRFPVQYFISRAGSEHRVPSPILWVDADYGVLGLDHDGAPALYNPHLPDVEIRGAVSDKPNHVDISDADQPVTATVVLSGDPKIGQWIDLYWGDNEEPVASYRVKVGDYAGKQVTFTPIPWSVIEETLNNPRHPVCYITNKPTTVGVNEQLSPDTFVNIHITAPVNFPRVEYVGVNKLGWYNCQADPPIWDGIRVRVYKHTSILLNDEVRMKWQGTLGFAGDRPIPETAEVFIEFWTSTDEGIGYHDFIVPYRPYVEPMKHEAGASAEFSVWRSGVRVGSSSVRYVKFDRVYASNPIVYCGPGGIGPEGHPRAPSYKPRK
jgi:hypothetical protein